jgi:tellurite methyltransferase
MKYLKKYENWNNFHKMKSNNDKNIDLIYERNPNESINNIIDGLKPDSKILDLGCGDGVDSLYFYSMGFEVFSLDISDYVIEENKEKNSNIDWKVYDISTAKIPYDIKFDLIYSRLSLHYFDKLTLDKILEDVKSKMVNGSKFYLMVKTTNKESFKTGKKFYNRDEWYEILSKYFNNINIDKKSGKLYNIDSEWLEIICEY